MQDRPAAQHAMELLSPLEAFYKLEKESAARTAFVQPHADHSVTEYNWQRVADEVRRMAAYLHALDLPEHSNITILAEQQTSYDNLIRTMDSSRSYRAQVDGVWVFAELFPDISIGDAAK